jgi:hypothetical protein
MIFLRLARQGMVVGVLIMMGSIVPTGLGTDNPRTYGFLGTYNYTGGSGTLNDNLIGTGISNTELFFYEDPTVITLYLEEYASINSC